MNEPSLGSKNSNLGAEDSSLASNHPRRGRIPAWDGDSEGTPRGGTERGVVWDRPGPGTGTTPHCPLGVPLSPPRGRRPPASPGPGPRHLGLNFPTPNPPNPPNPPAESQNCSGSGGGFSFYLFPHFPPFLSHFPPFLLQFCPIFILFWLHFPPFQPKFCLIFAPFLPHFSPIFTPFWSHF